MSIRLCVRLAAELSSGPGPAQSVQLGEREAGRESGAAGAGLPV